MVGSFFFNLVGLPAETNMPDDVTLKVMWDIAMSDPLRLFLPWLAGGYILAALTWPFWYGVYYFFVMSAKAAQENRRMRKVHLVAREITGQDE